MKSMFDKFFPQSLLEAVASNKADISDTAPKEIEFLLVKVSENSPGELKQAISEIIDISHENGAVVEDIVSSFVVVSYGAKGNETSPREKEMNWL